MRDFLVLIGLLILEAVNSPVHAEDPAAPDRASLVAAVRRGIPVLEKAARNYPNHRQCFACHHQTLPLAAIDAARGAALTIETTVSGEIREFTSNAFRTKLADLHAGENIGGRALTIGYALWTLQLAGAESSELTEAMVAYLIKTQETDGHWGLHAMRPPAEESLAMCATLAATGIRKFAAESQREAAREAVDRTRKWLTSTESANHEDQVAKVWGLFRLGGPAKDTQDAVHELCTTQRTDGGWAQNPDMESDAYATGTAAFVLLDILKAPGASVPSQSPDQPTSQSPDDARIEPAILRGAAFLARTQLEDGSWHVKTRAKPVQVYFDNGDPHGKDQFISISATGWATAALAKAAQRLPTAEATVSPSPGK